LPQITAQSPYWETLLILDKIREQMGKELDKRTGNFFSNIASMRISHSKMHGIGYKLLFEHHFETRLKKVEGSWKGFGD
jgi:hypothetical protein